ncbi:hypothetical protein B0T21DRAFT_363390 [Apiosordaria backusii]|uniref:Uncharacterized protein n=1 Tax=Apiosordaria backusii TaxID=314023 RepID=A0AA40EIA4_9PEZI|nr:hypothetical protein B0T21DRAFT_363390 [Apiosordaria backusii]
MSVFAESQSHSRLKESLRTEKRHADVDNAAGFGMIGPGQSCFRVGMIGTVTAPAVNDLSPDIWREQHSGSASLNAQCDQHATGVGRYPIESTSAMSCPLI